jgi:hypothetical protein
MVAVMAKAPEVIVEESINPSTITQEGLTKFPGNIALRLIHAAHWATVHAAGKTYFRPQHVVVNLVGPAGVGKTSTVEDYCRQEGIGYVRLDTAVTDIAEVFGMVFVNQTTGETTWAKPHWWPEDNSESRGIICLDDFTRAAPHIQSSLQQFILERSFNGAIIPDTWSLVLTSNPSTMDDAVYNVSELDPAQLSRMISVPWSPSEDVFYEQLSKQDVDGDLMNFWMKNPEMVRMPKPKLEEAPDNPRMKMIFNRIYPYIKEDKALLDFVGTSMFGTKFMATFKSFMTSEQPLDPLTIIDGKPFKAKIDKWEKDGRNDLISITIQRLVLYLKKIETVDKKQFEAVSEFMKGVPIEAGLDGMRKLTDTNTPFGNRFVMLVMKDKELMDRYKEHMRKVQQRISSSS